MKNITQLALGGSITRKPKPSAEGNHCTLSTKQMQTSATRDNTPDTGKPKEAAPAAQGTGRQQACVQGHHTSHGITATATETQGASGKMSNKQQVRTDGTPCTRSRASMGSRKPVSRFCFDFSLLQKLVSVHRTGDQERWRLPRFEAQVLIILFLGHPELSLSLSGLV